MICERCEAKVQDVLRLIEPGEVNRWTCVQCGGRWVVRMTRWRKNVRLRYWSGDKDREMTT